MDRVTVAITRYVIAKMSEKYVQPPTLDYAAIYRQSTQMTPIVFVLSPGADPAFDVFKLGRLASLKGCMCLTAPCVGGQYALCMESSNVPMSQVSQVRRFSNRLIWNSTHLELGIVIIAVVVVQHLICRNTAETCSASLALCLRSPAGS